MKLHRGTREQFFTRSETIPDHVGVCLLTDTGQLAYRDGCSPTGWEILDGELIPYVPGDPGEVGMFTLDLNVRVRTTNGVYRFNGYRIVPSVIHGHLITQLLHRDEKPVT